LDEYQEKIRVLSEKNTSLSSRSIEKEEQLEEAKERLSEKISGGGEDGGEGGGGAGTIIRTKQAIQRLQSEIQEMFLATHFLNNQLLRLKQRSATDRLTKMKKYKKSRRKGKSGGRFAHSKDHKGSSDEELTD
jgi:predicted  nucleic acid-binding Zn-ribbon protein